MKAYWITHMTAAVVMSAAITFAHAAEQPVATQTATAELRQFFAGQDAANHNGASTEELVHRFYAGDATVIGEGAAGPTRGLAGAIKALTEWNDYLGPGGNKGCNFEIKEPVVASGQTASVFAELKCKANPPKLAKDETIRQLFVLKKTANGWRVVQEMWQSGGFPD
ncbi:hypothetical protein ACTJJ7_12055 [Phyllobacterium sp. 22229]|uniref:SnoaL-like domain-containing protein n=1 Tax=Agrobacterium radiobacter TaxID=362 RepID=A0ABD5LKV5_AGRRD